MKERITQVFTEKVPEIAEGLVQIRVATRVGPIRRRTKVIVRSSDPDIDPVGACIGMRGSRIAAILKEVDGTIDVLDHRADPRAQAQAALPQLIIGHSEMSDGTLILGDVVFVYRRDPEAKTDEDRTALEDPATLRAAVATELALAAEVSGLPIALSGEPRLKTL